MLPSNHSPAQAQNERKITSLEMSEITQTLHKNLLQSVRNQEVGWFEVTGLKFQLSEYKDSSGRILPMYEFTKAESLYIASKFNDVVRAKLVARWMELEHAQQGRARRSINLRSDEVELLGMIKKYIIPGDMNKIAYDLKVNRRTVNAVKVGKARSARILSALVDRAFYNKKARRELVVGYDHKLIRDSINRLKNEA